MRRLRGRRRGLAEIVGTLMLVLIVVVAVTAFSVFITQYEQQVLAQQGYQHDKSLEALRIVSLVPGGLVKGNYSSMSFTIGSEDLNSITITNITLNDDPVTNYTFTTPTQPTQQWGVANLVLNPEGDATIGVTFPGSFAVSNLILSADSYLKLSLYTSYENDFVSTFLPPTPIIHIDTESAGDGTSGGVITILDGSQSFQEGGNASLVSWDWTCTITPVNNSTDGCLAGGGGAGVLVPTLSPMTVVGKTYWINLTVANSDGLMGVAKITYSPS